MPTNTDIPGTEKPEIPLPREGELPGVAGAPGESVSRKIEQFHQIASTAGNIAIPFKKKTGSVREERQEQTDPAPNALNHDVATLLRELETFRQELSTAVATKCELQEAQKCIEELQTQLHHERNNFKIGSQQMRERLKATCLEYTAKLVRGSQQADEVEPHGFLWCLGSLHAYYIRAMIWRHEYGLATRWSLSCSLELYSCSLELYP